MVAAFATWHFAHDAALTVVQKAPSLPAHSGLEAYSVLTRLPPPNRAVPHDVRAFLARAFPGPWLVLPGEAVALLVEEFVTLGISGGATYDGAIGATARAARATLYTCDRRARTVYERLGVEVQFVG